MIARLAMLAAAVEVEELVRDAAEAPPKAANA